jgi:ribosome-associated heat shock protein Hsp15
MQTAPIVPQPAARQRIDKWLWFARIVKTRTLAQKLAVSGRVRVNRDKCDSASHALKVGDVLTIALDPTIRIVKVLQPGVRRGPPADARLLYEDLSPAAPSSIVAPAPIERTPGSGRPTKRDQRRLAALQRAGNEDFPSSKE